MSSGSHNLVVDPVHDDKRSPVRYRSMDNPDFNKHRIFPMSHCCTGISHSPKKQRCPASGNAHAEVSVRTITHQLMRPWEWNPGEQRYFFCDDPDCDVVYFGEDGSIIRKTELRTLVGVKESSADAPLCYCYGINKSAAHMPGLRDYVIGQTREGNCACETRNPSGRCCLKDFPAGEGWVNDGPVTISIDSREPE